MPGYRALPIEFSGPAAEHVRYAEVLQRAGDADEAVRMLEGTLELYALSTPELPGWLCGRLAALYRALKRYDDEVALLERYRESQSSEDARTRFDARLSKARAIAERNRRTDTRALSSVRRVINGHEDDDMPITNAAFADDDAFPATTAHAVREALVDAAQNGTNPAPGDDALTGMCVHAHQEGHPPERLVAVLKEIWRGTPRPERIDVRRWEAIYRSALTRMLALYFDDPYA